RRHTRFSRDWSSDVCSSDLIIRGMYLLDSGTGHGPRVQLLGSGTILNEVRAAAQLLQEDFGVVADVWSVTSFNELARDGQHIQRWNMLHPNDKPQESYVARCLDGMPGPVVASTDYIRLYAEQIRPYLSRTYRVLGTDGFGRSDTRQK